MKKVSGVLSAILFTCSFCTVSGIGRAQTTSEAKLHPETAVVTTAEETNVPPSPSVLPPVFYSKMYDGEKGVQANVARSQWTMILQNYTYRDGRGYVFVDYHNLSRSSAHMENLNAYIDTLRIQYPSTLPKEQAIVYWANLYNALTVQIVAQNWPVQSIREIKSGYRKGPWRRKLITIEGQNVSLDDIEHKILRPLANSPLVHYMLNCASIGCPNLKQNPWVVETLDTDLENAARAYVNSERGVRIENGRIQVSKIYKWFRKDFGGSTSSVLTHLRKYADPRLRAELNGLEKFDAYAYDWSINVSTLPTVKAK